MTPELARILEALEIVVVREGHRMAPGETRAVKTLDRLLAKFGEEHLIFVLRTINESRNNKRALYSHVIEAVSDIARKRENWTKDTDRWFRAFDTTLLEDLEHYSRETRDVVKKRSAIAAWLLQRLGLVFAQPEPQMRIRGT